jgi:ABC-type bacteriocin/lantibiotic exporter with double-glycine peptidase domain
MAAKVLGKIIFDVIDRKPLISNSPNSIKEIVLNEFIKFKNVTFKYPTAPKEFKNILENASFEIKAG